MAAFALHGLSDVLAEYANGTVICVNVSSVWRKRPCVASSFKTRPTLGVSLSSLVRR